jgi:hypothetical protein
LMPVANKSESILLEFVPCVLAGNGFQQNNSRPVMKAGGIIATAFKKALR